MMDILKPANICCLHSNCSMDAKLYSELEKHLKPLDSSQQIRLWHSGNPLAGENPAQEIVLHISTADIILLLLSPDFLVSPLYEEHMELVLGMLYRQQAHVIPIHLRPNSWEFSPIFYMKVFPRDGRPITTRSGGRDTAFRNVIQDLYPTIMSVRITPRVKYPLLERSHRTFSLPFAFSKEQNPLVTEGPLRLLSTPGLQVSGQYKLVGMSSRAGEMIARQLPPGISDSVPVSVSICSGTRKNLTPPSVSHLDANGVLLYSFATGANLSCEATGKITIQY